MKYAAGVAMSVAVLLSAAANGQAAPPATGETAPTVMRRFLAPGLDEAIAYAELVDIKHVTTAADPANAVIDAAADAIADFVPVFGHATSISPMPMTAIRGVAVLFRFPNQKSVVAFMENSGSVRGSSGHHACRIVTDSSKGKPESDAFLILNRWCMHAVALSNIDDTAIRK